MRDIKFRGKRLKEHDNRYMHDSDNPIWVCGNLVIDKDGHVSILNDHGGFRTCDEVDPKTVGQFTGLMDKNGKEIYEGDIVTEHHGGLAFDADFFQTEQVKWDTFGYLPFQRVIGGTMHDFAKNLKEYIVIGNIYENPELLKG